MSSPRVSTSMFQIVVTSRWTDWTCMWTCLFGLNCLNCLQWLQWLDINKKMTWVAQYYFIWMGGETPIPFHSLHVWTVLKNESRLEVEWTDLSVFCLFMIRQNLIFNIFSEQRRGIHVNDSNFAPKVSPSEWIPVPYVVSPGRCIYDNKCSSSSNNTVPSKTANLILCS